MVFWYQFEKETYILTYNTQYNMNILACKSILYIMVAKIGNNSGSHRL